MSEYLSKEEVRQWRSSLEKITLEEFAARLGKKIQNEKETNDMVDIVMTHTHEHEAPIVTSYEYPAHETQKIAISEPEVEHKPVKPVRKHAVKSEKPAAKHVEKSQPVEEKVIAKSEKTSSKPKTKKAVEDPAKTESEAFYDNISFKKPLIAREKMILDYLIQNKNTVVYAKNMAELLDLPRDYVYKYIKNLRCKINEDVLVNADNGGYVLKFD